MSREMATMAAHHHQEGLLDGMAAGWRPPGVGEGRLWATEH
ncbi:hypothetical protein [Candidatus Nephthysia bennettiae]